MADKDEKSTRNSSGESEVLQSVFDAIPSPIFLSGRRHVGLFTTACPA